MKAPLRGIAATVVAASLLLAGIPVASASYESALEAFERKENRNGVAALRAAAHEGDSRAQNFLGTLFESGRFVSRDFGRAAFWYRKSAEQGNPDGQLNLGRVYRGGLGIERDERRAAYWYRAAAVQGLATAQFFLGVMYEAGRGVERDLAKSWMWFTLAAEQGDEDARFRRNRLAAAFDDKGLAKAHGALRGYREAAAARGVEPDSSGAATVATTVPRSDAEAAGREEARALVRGNPLVFRIQGALIELGYSPGAQDGEAGARTRKALRKFESEHGYRRRGRLDERSLQRLRDAVEAGTPASSVVREIQEHLRRLGHSVGAIDGRAGPRTTAAVEAFQRSRDLPVDGRLSLDLLTLLRHTVR